MLQITKQGNSIVVEGLNHYFYPYNGTLEVPCNSVITVVDEGDIVLFRSASNYDVLFSAKIDEITIGGQSVTKDNVGEVFGALSNVSSGGGGLTPEQEEKLNSALQSETDPVWTAEKVNYYTKSEVNTSLEIKADKSEIPTVPTNVSAFTNDAGYLTEHQSLNDYYTKTESDGKYATQVVVNEEIAARISDIREVKAAIETKADKSEIPSLNGYATEQWVGDKGYITEETDPTVPSHVKAITEEDIAKWNQGGYDVYQWSFYPYSYATKNVGFTFTKNGSTITGSQGYRVEYKRHSKTGEIDGTYQTVSSESFLFKIPLTDDTIFIVASLKKDIFTYLDFSFDVVSNIKGGGITEETDPVWTAEKGNYYTKTEVNASLETKADKTEIPNLNGYATEQWVGEQGYLTEHQQLKTINGESIIGNGDIVISGGGEETDPVWTAEKSNYYTKSEIDGIVGNVNNALSEIING